MWKRIFIAVWHDPVGSKVISGIILIPVAAAVTGLWSGSGFSFNGAAIWAGAKSAAISFIGWTATPLPISRASLALVVFLGVIGWGLAALLWLYDLRRRIDSLRTAQTYTVTRERIVAAAPQKPSMPTPDELGIPARKILALLFRGYGQPIQMRTISGAVDLSFPACEQLCEKLDHLKLITVTTASHSMSCLVALTKVGRDYCLKHGKELPPPADGK